ncbi:MAG: hypothetical protein WCJ35_17320 [Planctomycetota bacterium]
MKGICFARCACRVFAMMMLVAGLLAATPQVSLAQLSRRCDPCPTTPSTGAAQPGTGAQAGSGDTSETSPAANLFAQQDVGAAGGGASAAPTMIGDFLGSSGMVLTLANSPTRTRTVAPPGGAVPRFKMAENTSPMPMDRVYFDYGFYHNVQLNDPPSDVNAITSGFEKTFLGGMMSFEMRLPMASTLDSNVYLDGTTRTHVGEIGDLGMALKCLLIQCDTVTLSGGLAMTVPTAQDSQYFANSFDSNPQVIIKNRSVHLLPFVGGLWIPNDRWFGIGYFQLDIDSNGDPVDANNTTVGRYRDATMMYLDLTVGYWAFRGEEHRFLTGLAGVLEVHVNQSLNTASVLEFPSGNGTVGSPSSISIVDMTVGAHAEVGKYTTLTAGYCTPLTNQRQFDGEFRMLMNYRF